ncbi:MAG: hypothetical protein KW788_02140 [Candidatus Doudnabacteria bacterium]|nr:hypothetical protein [Candidatus Doudnabacteria bacterium]
MVLSSGTVYMVTGGQLRGFPSADVFTSWGNGFGGVQQATAEDLALPMGPVLVYADGTLVKGPNDPLVYLVASGQKRGFTTGSVFTGLGFKFSNIQSAPANTFADLPTGANLNSATERHTAGVWVLDSTGTVWRMTATGRVGLPSMAVFNSWGKSFATVVSANAADMAAAVEGVAQAKPSCGSSNPPPSGGMSVTTSGPVGSTLIETSVANNLADFTFNGNGTITSLVLERTGVSTSSTLSNVYLFDGSTRLTDAYTFGSDNKLTMSSSSLFSVSGSKTVSVRADVAASTAGQSVGVKLNSYNGNAVSVMGNSFSIAANPGSGGLSTATFGSVTPSGSVDPGNDLTLWQSTLTVASHDVWFTRLSLRKIGSINNSDVNNFKLYINGVQQAASFSLNADGYVTLTPASPVKLTTTAHVIRVAGDIIGGSTRTLRLSLRNKADIGLVDASFNAGVGIGTAVPLDAGTDLTVSGGTFTVVKAGNSPSGNVVKDATDVVVGKWTVTALGEPLKIETLNFGIDTSLTDANVTFRSVRVLVNGSQVGATTSVAAEDFGTVVETGTQFTTNFTVQPGVPATVELRADMFDNEGGNDIVNAATLVASMIAGDWNNGTFQNSLTVTDVANGTVGTANNTPANSLTIVTGTMALAKQSNYTNQTTNVPLTNYALGKLNLTGNASEDVNVTSISVDLTSVTNATFSSADITNMYIKYGNQTSTVKSSVSATGNAYSVSFVLAKNSVVPIEIYGNVGSTITAADSIKTTTTITGTTVGSATAVTTGAVDGQTIIYGAGTVATAVSGSTPIAAILYSNQTADVAQLDVITTNDSFTITELKVKFAALPTSLTQVHLKDGGSVLQSQPAAASVTFTGLSIPVGANVTKTLTAAVTVGNVGTGAGATGESVLATFDDVKTLNSQGTEATDATDRAGTAQYAYKTTPQIDAVALGTTALSNSNVVLNKFQVQGNGGTIGWKKLVFTVTKTSAPVVTNATLWDMTAGGTQVAGAATLTTVGSTNLSGSIAFVATTEQQISSAHVYELRADVASSVAGDSISSKINNGTAYAASAAYATVAGTAANVAWTDRSLNGHSESTLDWTNENSIKNLPTTLQTLSR